MKSELDKHLNTVLHKRIDETACYNLSAKPSMVMVTATIRTRNILDRYYFETVRDLVLKTEKELLSLEQFGPVAIKEVKAWLKQAYDGKLWLGMTEEDLEEFQ